MCIPAAEAQKGEPDSPVPDSPPLLDREDRESGNTSDKAALNLEAFVDDNIDFRCPGDARDVDPADLPDFPALAGVR